jgi:phenylacetate-CoA ligase
MKYGPVFDRQVRELANNCVLPQEVSLERQRVALREMLTYAVTHVPYYRARQLPPSDFAAWPVIDKQTVIAKPEQFLSDEFAPDRLLTVHTSGTTGTPLAVRFTPDFNQLENAFRWRHRSWAGLSFPCRSAYVSGHPVVPAKQTWMPFWRRDRVEQRLLCSSYHLARQYLPHYVGALRDWAPDFIHGYPSSLYVLAQGILEWGLPAPHPRAVFTGSETLLDFQRVAIERAFGTKVFNWYGNSEFTCNIIECAAGRLHYRTDYGVLEVEPDGTMICTGLNNRAMPLIRYRQGDRVTLAPAAANCPCGCTFPIVERVEGRLEDYVRTPDGRYVGRLDHLFKDARGVREAQLVQTRLDELVVRVVKAGNFDEQPVRAEARQRLGDAVRLRFEYVDAIKRTPAGKFRFVVSQLPREQLELPGR